MESDNRKRAIENEEDGFDEYDDDFLPPAEKVPKSTNVWLPKEYLNFDAVVTFGKPDGSQAFPQKTSEIVPIPLSLCGAMIGKGGEHIKKLQESSRCKLQFVECSEDSPTKPLEISGLPENVKNAKRMIDAFFLRYADDLDSPIEGNTVETIISSNEPEMLILDLPVPLHWAGMLIGKSGETIRFIQEACSCKMQMLNTIVNSGTANAENTLRIVGLPDNIVAAKTMVSDFLEKFEAQKQMATDPLKHKIEKTEKICFDMPIPPEVCGLIIGRGGETMKRLRSLTNCNLNLLQSSHETTHEPKPLRIIGFPDDVEKAKSMVASIIEDAPRMKESGPGSHMPGNSTMAQSTQINVPRSSVGAIIGLKGATIKRLSDDVGVKIQFMPDDDPTMAERGIVIMGTPNKIKIAVQMITDIVNSSGAMSTPSTLFYMVIPASKCGLVIGKNGDNIKSIMAQSGAHCELSKEPEESPVEKTFLIKGEDFQVEHAKHLICIAVGEIPPNTPFSYQGNAPAAVAPTYPTPTYPTPIATQPQTDFSDQWLQYYMSIGDYQSVEMTKAHMQMKMMNNGQ